MTRVVVLAFAISMVHESWYVGVAGWPEATLAIAIVLTMPILSALERVTPKQAIGLVKDVLGRFGVGETRRGVGNVMRREPWKHDDHRDDRRDGDRNGDGDGSATGGEGENGDSLHPTT